MTTGKLIFGGTCIFIVGILLFFMPSSTLKKNCFGKRDHIFIYEAERNGASIHLKTTYHKIPKTYVWNFSCLDEVYGTNGETVFYYGHTIRGADLSTFENIDGSHYAKDKNHVYCNGGILKDADPNSFMLGAKDGFPVGGNPAHDKNGRYYCGIEA